METNYYLERQHGGYILVISGPQSTPHHYNFKIDSCFHDFFRRFYKLVCEMDFKSMKSVEGWIDKTFLANGETKEMTINLDEDIPDYPNDEGDIEGRSFYLLFHKRPDIIDIPRRLAKVLALYDKGEACLRTGNKCWRVKFQYSWFSLGWRKFSTAHSLKEGYLILIQHTRLNILDVRIFDKLGKEIRYKWLDGISRNSLTNAALAHSTTQREFAKPFLNVEGIDMQRTATEFYALEMYWNNYTTNCWDKVPIGLRRKYGQNSSAFYFFARRDFEVIRGVDLHNSPSWNSLVEKISGHMATRILCVKDGFDEFRLHVFNPSGVEKKNVMPLLSQWSMKKEVD